MNPHSPTSTPARVQNTRGGAGATENGAAERARPEGAGAAPISPADLAIDLRDMRKAYRRWPWSRGVAALRGVSLSVRRGEVFGLLGPNGAGKSTLVKILMTVIRASHGRGTMLGRRVGSKSSLLRIGYLPEHHRFPDYLTAAQVLDFFGGMSGLARGVRRGRSAALLEQVGLGRWAHARVREFSKGMRQRLGIAQALMNDPELLLLDEPTDGVDPVGRREIRELLLHERARGRTVFLNSHLLSELEMVCDRVAIMVRGRVTQLGTIDDLTAYGQRYELDIAPPASEGSLREAVKDVVPGLAMVERRLPRALLGPAGMSGPAGAAGPPDLTVSGGMLSEHAWIEVEGRTIRIGTPDAHRVQPLVDAVRRAGLTIATLRSVRPTLEDLFMRAVTDEATGQTLKPGAAEGDEA